MLFPFFLYQIFDNLALATSTAPIYLMVTLAAFNPRGSKKHLVCINLDDSLLLSWLCTMNTKPNPKVTTQYQCLACIHQNLLVFFSRPSPIFNYVILKKRLFKMIFIKACWTVTFTSAAGSTSYPNAFFASGSRLSKKFIDWLNPI